MCYCLVRQVVVMACREFEMGKVRWYWCSQLFHSTRPCFTAHSPSVLLCHCVTSCVDLICSSSSPFCCARTFTLFCFYLFLEKVWVLLATEPRAILRLWAFYSVLCKYFYSHKAHFLFSCVPITEQWHMQTFKSSTICATWHLIIVLWIKHSYRLKMHWWLFLLQDSEEKKGDYLTRTLRLTYRNVSICLYPDCESNSPETGRRLSVHTLLAAAKSRGSCSQNECGQILWDWMHRWRLVYIC